MSERTKQALAPTLRFPAFRDFGDWDARTLGDKNVSAFVKERTPLEKLKLENYVSTENLLPDYSGVTTASKLPLSGSFTRFKKGDILISNIRPYLKKVWPADKEGASSNDVIVIRAQSKVSDVFLRFLLQNDEFINYIMKGAKGVKMPRGDISLMKEYPVAFPNTDEQQKIADCLSSIDELVTAQTQKIEALKAHKKGLMQQLFPAEGETIPKLRFPEFWDARDWEESALGDIATIRSGSTPLRSNLEFFEGGNIPWVKTTDLNNSFIFKTEECITTKANAKINPEDSVLVAMYGGFNQIGRTGYLKVPAATNQAISVLNAHRKKVLPTYLLIWLNAKVEDWKRVASSSRKDPNITGSDVANFPIIYPEITEQQKIADCLSSIDDLITTQTQKLAALKAHKKGLMQQLFPAVDEVSV